MPRLSQFNEPDSLTPDAGQKYPLAEYAAEYWPQHAGAIERNTGGLP